MIKQQLILRHTFLLLGILAVVVGFLTTDINLGSWGKVGGQLMTLLIICNEVFTPMLAIEFSKALVNRFRLAKSDFNDFSVIITSSAVTDEADSSQDGNINIATSKRPSNITPSNRRSMITQRANTAKRSDTISLKDIISNKQLKQEFADFLAKEFAIESLLFIEAVVRHRKMCRGTVTKQTVVAACEAIKNEFLMPNSPNEVNINVSIKKHIMATIESLASNFSMEEARTAFDPAANDVGNMLSNNFLSKFKAQMLKK